MFCSVLFFPYLFCSVFTDDGDDVGVTLGTDDGDDVGVTLGTDDGDDVGVTLGTDDGDDVGVTLGTDDGDDVGVTLGTDDGDDVGVVEGIRVGSAEGRVVGAVEGFVVGFAGGMLPEQPPAYVMVVTANPRPSKDEAKPKDIDVYARMLPTITLEAPILTLVLTDHHTLDDLAPLSNTTDEEGFVVSVEVT